MPQNAFFNFIDRYIFPQSNGQHEHCTALVKAHNVNGVAYFRFDMPLLQSPIYELYTLTEHHISVYSKTLAEERHQYHYTAKFKDAHHQHGEVHVYFNAKESCIDFSFKKEGQLIEPSDEMKAQWTQVAYQACRKRLSTVRIAMKEKIAALINHCNQLEDHASRLSEIAPFDSVAYHDKLDELCEAHQQKHFLTLEPRIHQKIQRLQYIKIHFKPALAAEEKPSATVEKNREEKEAVAAGAHESAVKDAPLLSIDPEITQLQDDFNALKSPKSEADAKILSDILRRCHNLFFKLQEGNYTGSSMRLAALISLEHKINQKGRIACKKAIKTNQPNMLNALENFGYAFGEQDLVYALECPSPDLLDLILKASDIPLDETKLSFKDGSNKNAIQYTFDKAIPSCFVKLIQHGASLFNNVDATGLSIAYRILSQDNHPFRPLLEEHILKTAKPADFYRTLLKELTGILQMPKLSEEHRTARKLIPYYQYRIQILSNAAHLPVAAKSYLNVLSVLDNNPELGHIQAEVTQDPEVQEKLMVLEALANDYIKNPHLKKTLEMQNARLVRDILQSVQKGVPISATLGKTAALTLINHSIETIQSHLSTNRPNHPKLLRIKPLGESQLTAAVQAKIQQMNTCISKLLAHINFSMPHIDEFERKFCDTHGIANVPNLEEKDSLEGIDKKLLLSFFKFSFEITRDIIRLVVDFVKENEVDIKTYIKDAALEALIGISGDAINSQLKNWSQSILKRHTAAQSYISQNEKSGFSIEDLSPEQIADLNNEDDDSSASPLLQHTIFQPPSHLGAAAGNEHDAGLNAIRLQ